jgi:hypothetical protein
VQRAWPARPGLASAAIVQIPQSFGEDDGAESGMGVNGSSRIMKDSGAG